jgi:hypothetical protein
VIPRSTLLAATADESGGGVQPRGFLQYWLTECAGFAVFSGSRRLGVVTHVEYDEDGNGPAFVHVAGALLGNRRWRIPAGEAQTISPRARRLTPRSDGGTSTSESHRDPVRVRTALTALVRRHHQRRASAA